MSDRRIVVVGGGLAGITAALACADAGAQVTLLEARPRLGGATWSAQRDGLWLDNGQHVFLRCCSAYRGLLKRMDAEDGVHLQSRLAVPVVAPGGPVAWLRGRALPSPLHLADSLLRFSHLSLRDRLRVAFTVTKLGRLDLDDRALDERSFGAWLREQGEPERAIQGFWELLVRPTVNVPANDASLALAAKVFQTGLLEGADHADIGWATVPLQQLHGDNAARALERAGVAVRLRARVDAIEGGPALRLHGERLDVDAVVLATPHEAAASLLPPEASVDPADLAKLGRSPILNLHVVYDRPVMEGPFVAGIGTPLEWVFDRTQSAGLDTGQCLAVSLSAADAWVGRSLESLRAVFEPALRELFPRAARARLLRFYATSEPAATFWQGPGTRRLRPRPGRIAPGVHVAGAWTDTGWPATMEGAVRSGMLAAQSALAVDERARTRV